MIESYVAPLRTQVQKLQSQMKTLKKSGKKSFKSKGWVQSKQIQSQTEESIKKVKSKKSNNHLSRKHDSIRGTRNSIPLESKSDKVNVENLGDASTYNGYKLEKKFDIFHSPFTYLLKETDDDKLVNFKR